MEVIPPGEPGNISCLSLPSACRAAERRRCRKENAPALVAVESEKRLDADGFRDAAERIRAEVGELLPGVEYSEGGDAFSLSFPTEVKPKKAKA